jgi:hypothetical protein
VLIRGQANPTIAGVVNASSGQTEFTIPFAAAGPGTADEFTAFVITTLFDAQVFALEIGRAAGTTGLVVTNSDIIAVVSALIPTRSLVTLFEREPAFAPTQSVSKTMDEQITTGGTTYRAFSGSMGTRTVTISGGTATITGSVLAEPRLSAQPPPPGGPGAGTTADSSQLVCFDMPGPYLATYSVQSNVQDPSDRFNTALRLTSTGVQQNAIAGDSGSVVLPSPGFACVAFDTNWTCSLDFLGNPQCGTPSSLTGTYTVTLRPAQ